MSEVRLVASMEGPDGAPVRRSWPTRSAPPGPSGTPRPGSWREDFRLLRFELRGHGAPGAQSDAPPGPYSIAELGTDVLGLMREHGVDHGRLLRHLASAG